MMGKRVDNELPLIIPPEWRYAFEDPDAQAVVQVAENPHINSASESRLLQQYREHQILTPQEAAAVHLQSAPPPSPRFPTTIWQSWDAVRAAIIEHVKADPPPSLVAAQERWQQGMQFLATQDRSDANNVHMLNAALNTMHSLLSYLAPYSQESLWADVMTVLSNPSLPQTARIDVLNMIGAGRIELAMTDWTSIIKALTAAKPLLKIMPDAATIATSHKFLLQCGNDKIEEWLAEPLSSVTPEQVLQGLDIFIVYNQILRHASNSTERKRPTPHIMSLASSAAQRLALDHDPTVRHTALQVLKKIGYDMNAYTTDHAALAMKLLHDPDASVQIAAIELLTTLADSLEDAECLEVLLMTRDELSADDMQRVIATARLHARMVQHLEWPANTPTPVGLIVRAKLRRLATTSPHNEVRAGVIASYPLMYQDVSGEYMKSSIFMRSALHTETTFFQDRMLHDPSPDVLIAAIHKLRTRQIDNYLIGRANGIDLSTLSSVRPFLHLLEHNLDMSVRLEAAKDLKLAFYFRDIADPAIDVPEILATLRRMFAVPHHEFQLRSWEAHQECMNIFHILIPVDEAQAALAHASNHLDTPDSELIDDTTHSYLKSIDLVVKKAPQALFSTDTFVRALAILRTYYAGSRTIDENMEMRRTAAIAYANMLNARQHSLLKSRTAISASGPLREELLAMIRDSHQCLSDPECPIRLESVYLHDAVIINLGQEEERVATK